MDCPYVSDHGIEGFRQMIDRVVDGDLQAKIVETGKFHPGNNAVFSQAFPDGRDRKSIMAPKSKSSRTLPN